MVVKPRSTHTTRTVLQALADGHTYGRQIIEVTGLYPGTVYPILNRLERLGWVVSEVEDIDPSVVGRPPRRFYELTEQGRAHLPPPKF